MMSLFTNPNTIAVSDGSSSTDVSSRGSDGYVVDRPRRRGGEYYARDRSASDSDSSVDDLVRYALTRRYTPLEREIGTVAGLQGSPFRPPRRSNGVEVDDHDVVENAESAARDAAYLQRLHRGLMAMRLKEVPDFGEAGADKARGKKRTISKEAIDRLTKRNASAEAKVQIPYEKRKEKEEAEQKVPVRVSATATKAGVRLYQQAKSQRAEIERLRGEQEEEDHKKADEELLFQPKITAYAERLAGMGYRTLEERQTDYKSHQEKKERKRLEVLVDEMQQYPFRPTLSSGTQRIVEERRASRSRGSRDRRSHSREAQDSGERLYRDGGERLLRQQIRQRLSERAQNTQMVGSRVKLSKTGQVQVHDRLEQWQRTREKNVASLREEAERLRNSKRQSTGGIHDAGRTATVDTVALVERLTTHSEASGQSRPSRRGSQPLRPLDRQGSTSSAGTEATGSRSSRQSSGNTRAPSEINVAGKEYLAQLSPQQRALYEKMRQIRFGALFYKYVAGSSEAVTLEQVQRTVDLVYSEDAGMLVALRSVAGSNPQISFTKDSFINALVQYERHYGPQPWARTEKDALLFCPPSGRTGNSNGTGTPRRAEEEVDRAAGGAAAAKPRPASRTPTGAAPSLTRTSSLASSSGPERANAPPVRPAQATAGTAATTSVAVAPKRQTPTLPGSPRFSRSASEKGVKVAGYDKHLSRMQGSTAGLQTRTYARAASAPSMDQCTFSPRLGKRTERLSNIELQRRAGYMMETQLRKKELQLVHTLTNGGGPAATVASLSEEALRSISERERLSASNVGELHEPSVELSSLSVSPSRCSASQQPELSSQPAPRRVAVKSPATANAMAELKELLKGPPPAAAVSALAAREALENRPENSTQNRVGDDLRRPNSDGGTSDASAQGSRGRLKAAKGFTEEDLNVLFDAMYRRAPIPRT